MDGPLLLPLEAEDVRRVLALLGRVATSPEPVALRKRQLAEGLAALVEADAWLWTTGPADAPLAPAADGPTLDGGWQDRRQRDLLLAALAHKAWRQLFLGVLRNEAGGDGSPVPCCRPTKPEAKRSGAPDPPPPPPPAAARAASPAARSPCAHVTCTRRDLVPDGDWYGSAYYLVLHTPTGLDDFLLSFYPLGDGNGNGDDSKADTWSTLAFWRSHGAEPFSARDRQLVHLVASEIDGLHRVANGVTHIHANGNDLTNLSPRQHQVLQLLLTGEGNKQIARKLKISEHTVCDYVKALHARFKVNSRSQLLARFVATETRRRPSDPP